MVGQVNIGRIRSAAVVALGALLALAGPAAASRVAGIDSSGRIVALGERGLARFSSGGQLDETFGDGGVAQLPVRDGCQIEASAMTLDDAGRIVVAGDRRCSPHFGRLHVVVMRFRPDGRPDPSFSQNGVMVAGRGYAGDVAVDPVGRVLVAGDRRWDLRPNDSGGFSLARVKPGGHLDGSFGRGGEVRTRFAEGLSSTEATSVALTPRGRILTAGHTGYCDRNPPLPTCTWRPALARYRANGSLDTRFGNGGKEKGNLPGTSSVSIRSLAEGEGGFVVAGFADVPDSPNKVLMTANYGAAGELDPTFGSHGVALTPFAEGQPFDASVFLGEAGRPLVIGGSCCSDPEHYPLSYGFVLAGYDAAGNLDQGFGSGGTQADPVSTALGGYNFSLEMVGGAVEPEGELIDAGSFMDYGSGIDHLILRAYTANGQPEAAFGSGGESTAAIPF